jgi:hypothetical protein
MCEEAKNETFIWKCLNLLKENTPRKMYVVIETVNLDDVSRDVE